MTTARKVEWPSAYDRASQLADDEHGPERLVHHARDVLANEPRRWIRVSKCGAKCRIGAVAGYAAGSSNLANVNCFDCRHGKFVSTPAEMIVGLIKFVVPYYDAKASRKGKGVQRATFDTRDEAEEFAKGKRCWARPAEVLEVSESKDNEE